MYVDASMDCFFLSFWSCLQAKELSVWKILAQNFFQRFPFWWWSLRIWFFQTQFMASLWELSTYFAASDILQASEAGDNISSDGSSDDGSTSDNPYASVTGHLNNLIHAFQEIIKLQNAVVDRASRSIIQNLSRFLKEDVKQMKDTKGWGSILIVRRIFRAEKANYLYRGSVPVKFTMFE